jgi:hypothetical protein
MNLEHDRLINTGVGLHGCFAVRLVAVHLEIAGVNVNGHMCHCRPVTVLPKWCLFGDLNTEGLPFRVACRPFTIDRIVLLVMSPRRRSRRLTADGNRKFTGSCRRCSLLPHSSHMHFYLAGWMSKRLKQYHVPRVSYLQNKSPSTSCLHEE